MAIDTDEIELHIASVEKFAVENPRTMAWLLHNFSVIKDGLDSGSTTTDLTALQAEVDAAELLIAALQASLAALEAQVDALDSPADISALEAAIAILQGNVIDLQAQIDNLPPPFQMPSGSDGQILTHGPGGDGDFFFADPADIEGLVYTLAQSGDLIPVNEGTADEAVLPEFMLDPDGKVMLIPVA